MTGNQPVKKSRNRGRGCPKRAAFLLKKPKIYQKSHFLRNKGRVTKRSSY
jgi:hypothetical protein